MKSISKKIFMEFVFFIIIFLVMIVSNNLIVNNVSSKENNLPKVQEYREIDKSEYMLNGDNNSIPQIKENLYQVTNKQIEKFVMTKDYLPGRIDPFANPVISEQSKDGQSIAKEGQNIPNNNQQHNETKTTPTSAPITQSINSEVSNTSNSSISTDDSDPINMRELPSNK